MLGRQQTEIYTHLAYSNARGYVRGLSMITARWLGRMMSLADTEKILIDENVPATAWATARAYKGLRRVARCYIPDCCVTLGCESS